MKKILIYTLCAVIHCAADAQQTPVPDINKLVKMSPAELAQYKEKMLQQSSNQVKQLAAKGNIGIDEMLLPGFELKAPVKDIKRLQLLPKRPPTFIEMADAVKASRKNLESVTPRAILDEVKTIITKQTPEQQTKTAIAAFYGEQPAEALLIAMNAALTWPEDVAPWNNLAALMNMSGLQHKAIPILMHHLQAQPNNSMLLNNMGQAYLGLGDLTAAEMFLQQCLAQDPLHPEANRSMGIIRYIQKQYDEGTNYFEKEQEVAWRQSSMALLRSKNKTLNIYNLRKKRANIPHKDFFDEVQLNKFVIPSFPENSAQVPEAVAKNQAFLASVTQELLYWNEKAIADKAQLQEEGKMYPGLYHQYVDALLDDLHKVYTLKDLSLFEDVHFNRLEQMLNAYAQDMQKLHCEEAPAGATMDVIRAFELKCCMRKKEIRDQLLAEYNGFVQMRINAVRPVWKQYLNDLFNIVSLCPTPANKRFVCGKLQEYYTWLSVAASAAQMEGHNCAPDMTLAQADSLITSSRDFELSCPSWLNIEIDLTVAKIKADCSKYELEASYGLLLGNFERNFRKGTSTISAGIGKKAKFFAGGGGAELKALAYVSFDNNGFSDLGLMGKAQVKIADNPFSFVDGIAKAGGTAAGAEGVVTLGIHSGFNSSVKGKGVIADFVKIDTPLK